MSEFDFVRIGPADYVAATIWARRARSRAMRGAGRALVASLGRALARAWGRLARRPQAGAPVLRRS